MCAKKEIGEDLMRSGWTERRKEKLFVNPFVIKFNRVCLRSPSHWEATQNNKNDITILLWLRLYWTLPFDRSTDDFFFGWNFSNAIESIVCIFNSIRYTITIQSCCTVHHGVNVVNADISVLDVGVAVPCSVVWMVWRNKDYCYFVSRSSNYKANCV